MILLILATICPSSVEKNARNGSITEVKSIPNKLVQKLKAKPPLPIRNGLNPSRVRLPIESSPMRAQEFIELLISSQRHRNPIDDAEAVLNRFKNNEVVNREGNPYGADDILDPGSDVWFYRMPAEERAVPYEIPIIYQDDDLLVIDKPPYLATMPRGRHITETALVKMRILTGNQELTPAHRLDRLTSGVLVMVARPELRGIYQSIFARREVTKTYEAIADFRPHLSTGHGSIHWESRIEKTPGDVQAHTIPGTPNAHTEVLNITPVSNTEQHALEQIHGPLSPQAHYTLKPTTGKTHQLRLHMYNAGVPILGDPLYPILLPVEAEDYTTPMHLIARTLEFTDPKNHSIRSFTARRTLLGEIKNP